MWATINMREITNRNELKPSKFDSFRNIRDKNLKLVYDETPYILEFKRFVRPGEPSTKAVAYYLKPENDRDYAPNIIQNSVWYIPSEAKYGRQGKEIYRAPQPYETNGIRVFEIPTKAKEIMAESVVRQRTGIELPEEIKANLRKSIRSRGGKHRKSRNTRKHRKSSKRTKRHHRK